MTPHFTEPEVDGGAGAMAFFFFRMGVDFGVVAMAAAPTEEVAPAEEVAPPEEVALKEEVAPPPLPPRGCVGAAAGAEAASKGAASSGGVGEEEEEEAPASESLSGERRSMFERYYCSPEMMTR